MVRFYHETLRFVNPTPIFREFFLPIKKMFTLSSDSCVENKIHKAYNCLMVNNNLNFCAALYKYIMNPGVSEDN